MAENINDKNESPELIARRQAGKEGKLWSIELLALDGSATRKWAKANLYWKEVCEIREYLFIYGVMMPIDPSFFVVIPPAGILSIQVRKQKTLLDYDPTRW